jgi:DNA-binding CsgD family transcriptional regulator
VLETATLELAEAETGTGTVQERAKDVLEVLMRHVPCDAAWMATVEPSGRDYTTAASANLSRGTVAHLAGPQMARDIERTQADRPRPPLSLSDVPYPATELPTWAECLTAAGFRDALSVALVDHRQRHVGFLTLLYGSSGPPEARARRVLHHLVPVVARGVDPLQHLTAAAQLLDGATAGAVLYPQGRCGRLPGLGVDALLTPGSPVLAVARTLLTASHPFGAFLWPRGGRHAPDGHARVTVLSDGQRSSTSVLGAVVLSVVEDCRGLTPRELEVLGLLVEGWSNSQIARRLVLTPRTVATHVEHVLRKLDAPTRTLAAVRADREGLYVPSALSAGPGSRLRQ